MCWPPPRFHGPWVRILFCGVFVDLGFIELTAILMLTPYQQHQKRSGPCFMKRVEIMMSSTLRSCLKNCSLYFSIKKYVTVYLGAIICDIFALLWCTSSFLTFLFDICNKEYDLLYFLHSVCYLTSIKNPWDKYLWYLFVRFLLLSASPVGRNLFFVTRIVLSKGNQKIFYLQFHLKFESNWIWHKIP